MLPFLALAATVVLPPQLPSSAWAGPPPWSRPPFLHAAARGTATVEIITPAAVGAGLGAPRPGMVPRVASSVAGGTDRLLLVYDFE